MTRVLKKLIGAVLLAGISTCTFLEKCTMVVRVEGESKLIVADWSEFARIFDQPQGDEFDYRIEAVDGSPVMRKDHAITSWLPVVLLAGGEHTLTIGKGKRWLFEPPELELFTIQVSVRTGQGYSLVWEGDTLVLVEY